MNDHETQPEYKPDMDNLDCPGCRAGMPKMSDNPRIWFECEQCGLKFAHDEIMTYNRLRR